MHPYQQTFIEFCLANDALKFGTFTLKSGRISPYFFNAGMFKDGKAFYEIGLAYAHAIHESFSTKDYNVLFGPAYKGIALATAASIGLFEQHHRDVPVSFNRKEAKDHGEGGVIIGAALKDQKILLVDDVITAGTTVRSSVEIIQQAGGHLIGMVIALDRQERGLKSNLSAIAEVEKEFHLKVVSIITRDHLVEYLRTKPDMQKHLENMLTYREEYGASIK